MIGTAPMRRTLAIALPLLAVAACTCFETGPEFPAAWRGSGTEPFWSATIEDGHVLVERPGKSLMRRRIGSPVSTEHGWRFTGQRVAIVVVRQPCANAMSGAMFAETVTIAIDGRTLAGCGGEEQPPARLDNTRWIVTVLDGQSVALEPPPSLSIDAEGRVSGSDGCNRFRGGLMLDGRGDITAEDAPGGISTRMACPGKRDEVAHRYNALRAAVSRWSFDGAMLLLVTLDGKTIRLRRTY